MEVSLFIQKERAQRKDSNQSGNPTILSECFSVHSIGN